MGVPMLPLENLNFVKGGGHQRNALSEKYNQLPIRRFHGDSMAKRT